MDMTTTSASIAMPPRLPETELANVKPIRGRFDKEGVFNTLRNFYDEDSIRKMQASGVDSRMVFGINSYYMALVNGEGMKDAAGNIVLPPMPPSAALQHLVVPIIAEAIDISGERDPSNQIRYSPEDLKGKILHKYDEIVLGHAALACSAHCRYCYRLDLFNGSTGKGLVKPEELRDYVLSYNRTIAANGYQDPETGTRRWPITEILLSGGDIMVVTNKQLYKYLAACAEAGVDIIRLGTKEMAFRPMRFDQNLAQTLRIVHERYPHVRINVVTHFTHPDEFLERDEDGRYKTENGYHVWLKPVRQALENLSVLGFVDFNNQTPLIRNVNDDAQVLHLLHRALQHGGISSKYIFQCREIEGHKAFAVPVEEAWRLHNESQKGLSDGSRSRFVMSAEAGKTEVVSVTDACPDLFAETLADEAAADGVFGEGLVIMKLHRSPAEARSQGDLIIARRNPNALWLSDYEDRVIYDGREQGTAKYAGLIEALKAAADIVDMKQAKAA
jgi:lysine 2,3-aminomutase